jgi:hypothetical protein
MKESKLKSKAELITFYVQAYIDSCPICNEPLEEVIQVEEFNHIGVCTKCGTVGICTDPLLVTTMPGLRLTVERNNK